MQITQHEKRKKDPQVMMIAFYRRKVAKKKFEKVKKQYRYRYNVIREILETERNYVRDLKLIVEQVKYPLQNILQPDEINDIFTNLEEIYLLNSNYLQQLELGYQNFSKFTPYQTVISYVTSFLQNLVDNQGFNIYFDYCNGYTKSSKFQETIKQDEKYKNYIDFIGQLKKQNILKGMDLQSYLVKPIQRLPKYILLYKDLLKNTEKDHPDYKNISYQLTYFDKVNEENNKNMDGFIKKIKYQDLWDQYLKQSDLPRENEWRTYVFEEMVYIIENDVQVQVYLAALTDHILIIQDQKLLKLLKLSSISYVKNQPDTKYFANLFQLVSENSYIQFVSEKLQQKKNLMQEFDKLLENLRVIESRISGKKVLWLELRKEIPQSFQKHTIYITEIKIAKVALKIYLRYSEIFELYQKYRKDHKYVDIEFPQFPPEEWLTGHKTKTIEKRQRAIENFIQLILQNVKIDREQALKELRLPVNFYQLPQIEKEVYDKQVVDIMLQNKYTQNEFDDLKRNGIDIDKLKRSGCEILKAVIIEKQSLKVNVSKLIDSFVEPWSQEFKNQNNRYQHTIVIPNGQKLEIAVDDTARASKIVQVIAQIIKLEYYQDFRLFLIDHLDKQRVIDDDEILQKVIQDERKNTEGGVLNAIEKFLSKSQDDVTIYLKKYIYLTQELEEYDYRKDEKRLEILAYSIFDEVYREKYQLSFLEYCLYAAFYYQIHFHDKVEDIRNLQLDKIKRIVPKQYYKTVQESEWRNMVLKIIGQLNKKIVEIQAENMKSIQSGKKSEYPILHERNKLAQQMAMNSTKSNILYPICLFYVNTYAKTLLWMQQLGQKMFPNIYLGISLDKLYFFDPKRKQEFRSFSFKQIISIKSFPSQIIFEIENQKHPIRLDTYQSYEIKLLIEEYQLIQRFMSDYKLSELYKQ
ncbi:hypothetical protein pb186bvf_000971 [Paramecium bursaria]